MQSMRLSGAPTPARPNAISEHMVDILTLRLDPASQQRFDELRQLHFPPERNYIPAHLTMFHALPAQPWVTARVHSAAQAQTSFPLSVTGLRSLGKGVAYMHASPELHALHATLSADFAQELTPQDRQRFMPHIVVQNKVTPEAARRLLDQLTQQFVPWIVTAEGLDLWHYLGGPWQHVQTIPFRAASA